MSVDCLNRWCDFVLLEGIMPSPIVRLLKKKNQFGETREYNVEKIAKILIENSGFGKIFSVFGSSLDKDNPDIDIAEVAVEAFRADPDLLTWLSKETTTIEEIQNTKLKDEVIYAAVQRFIEECPLVDTYIKEKYKCTKIQNATHFRVFMSAENYIPFVDYLKKGGIKEDTISSYCSVINARSREYLPADKSIWNVNDPEEIKEFVMTLQKPQLTKYLEFLCFKNKVPFPHLVRKSPTRIERDGPSIADIVREKTSYLFQNGLIPDEEIQRLKDIEYSRNTFGLRYAFLKSVGESLNDDNGYKRYWTTYSPDPRFVVTSEWYDYHKDRFLAWYDKMLSNRKK